MTSTFFRRYRMEFDLVRSPLPAATLPDGYHWVPWNAEHIAVHSEVKYQSFRDEIDSRVFASLSCREGCSRLMQEIAKQSLFVPEATWLVQFSPDPEIATHSCATIQGIARSATLGAIQNVGVTPEHRGNGLGRAIVQRSLAGFRARGLRRVYLEVTAENTPAVELYRSIGFELTRTMYKAVDRQLAEA